MTHRRTQIRAAVRQLLNGLPMAQAGAENSVPFLSVSTPGEVPAEEGGDVDGRSLLDVSLEVAARAADEDGVDSLLAQAERRINGDRTLAGTVTDLAYQDYEFKADGAANVGVAAWTARIETYEV